MSQNIAEKENKKIIETDQMKIKGHLLQFDNTLIQLSNISFIASGDLEKEKISVKTVVILVFLALLFAFSCKIFGALMILFSVALIAYLVYDIKSVEDNNSIIKDKKFLQIHLNSGETYSIVFSKEFLAKVTDVFAKILEEESFGSGSINIDIKNCKLSGSSSIAGIVKN